MREELATFKECTEEAGQDGTKLEHKTEKNKQTNTKKETAVGQKRKEKGMCRRCVRRLNELFWFDSV